MLEAGAPLLAPPATGTMRVANLSGFHDLVIRLGGDPMRILESHGIDPRAFSDPDEYVDCCAAVDALDYCSTAFDDSLFGFHLAELQEPDIFGCAAALGRSAPTVRDGLRAFVEYLPITHSAEGDMHVVQTADRAELRWHCPIDKRGTEQANQQALVLNIKILKMLAGRDFRPSYINLSTAVRRKDVYIMEDKLHCQVQARAPSNSIAFPVGVLDQPVATASKLLYSLLGDYLNQMKRTSTTSIVDQVEAYVRASLSSGSCSLARCARKLGLSVRSLQMRLAESGLMFSDVLERNRVALAKDYLRRDDLTLDEITARLGYSEQTSFGRAFKRWVGTSPRAYRANNFVA